MLFSGEQIVNACVHNLSWTHFRSLLRIPDEIDRIITEICRQWRPI